MGIVMNVHAVLCSLSILKPIRVLKVFPDDMVPSGSEIYPQNNAQ